MTRKPSESEDEYFARIEFERRKTIEKNKQQKMAEEEKKRLRDLHYLKCPKCGMDLIEIDYKTIKADRCSGCEGGWLRAGGGAGGVEGGPPPGPGARNGRLSRAIPAADRCVKLFTRHCTRYYARGFR